MSEYLTVKLTIETVYAPCRVWLFSSRPPVTLFFITAMFIEIGLSDAYLSSQQFFSQPAGSCFIFKKEDEKAYVKLHPLQNEELNNLVYVTSTIPMSTILFSVSSAIFSK